MSKGKVKWIPEIVLSEMNEIKIAHDIELDAEALKKMAKFSKKGRGSLWQKEIFK